MLDVKLSKRISSEFTLGGSVEDRVTWASKET